MNINSKDFHSFLSEQDFKTLETLGKYENGYIDIDKDGHITSNYKPSYVASAWRTTNWVTGYAGNSDDIYRLNSVLYRVVLAANSGENYANLLPGVIQGLTKFSKFYEDQKNKGQVVETINKVKDFAVDVLKAISNESLEPQQQARPSTQLMEQSIIGSPAGGYFDGFNYYAAKINAYLKTHNNLTQPQQQLLTAMQEELVFGTELFMEFAGQKWRFKEPYDNLPGRQQDEQYKNDLNKKFFDHLESQSKETRSLIGSLLPSGFIGTSTNEDGKLNLSDTGGHVSPIGIRSTDKGFVMTQYNVGGAALGEATANFDVGNWRFHLAHKDIPIALYGQPLVCFGPYDKKEIFEKIVKIMNQAESVSRKGIEEAGLKFQSIFDKDKKIDYTVPARRFQVVGNCVTRNVLEWMVDVSQRANEVDLINDVMCFGQSRSQWSSPEIELAKKLPGSH